MDWTNAYDPTVGRDACTGLVTCWVTEDLYHESEMAYDADLGRWYHPSRVHDYNELLAIEFDWSQDEKMDNLRILMSCDKR